jgi:lipopolysaccharide export system protein LptA
MRLYFLKLSLASYIFVCFCFLSMGSSYVFAEKADRDKPIELESDTMTSDDSKNTNVYTGNVIFTQGTLIIKADELTVREDNQGFQHSTSIGNPTSFKQKREGKNEYIEGSAQRIEYDGRMDKVHLYSKASVKKGEDVVYGDYIVFDSNAEFAKAVSGNTKNKAGETIPGGRTRAIIQPKKKLQE